MVRLVLLAVLLTLGAAGQTEREWIASLERPGAGPTDIDKACRALALSGTRLSVPALAQVLRRPETREPARYALERIPGPAASQALSDALNSPAIDDRTKAGIAGSLARRKDRQAIPSLRALLRSPNPALATAAGFALARMGVSQGLADPHALLLAAEHVPAARAAAIYRRLYAPGHPELIRAYALRGLARVTGSAARPLLNQALKSDSFELQTVAVGELARLRDFAFAGDLQAMPPLLQVRALAALAAAGPAAAPHFRKAAASDLAPVRTAALAGLATLGGPADVPLLAQRAAAAGPEERTAARLALARLEDIDPAILAALASEADPRIRLELIRAAGDRAIPEAPSTLLRLAADPHPAVRRESIRALRETAAPSETASIVALLARSEEDDERQELARAAAAAVRRSPGLPVHSITASYESAPNDDVRAALLTVLSLTGSSQALPVLRKALQDSSPALRRAAINALAEWPSPEPLPPLLAIAQSSPNLAERVLALRAYLRLVQLPSDRTPSETAKLLASAMAAAARPEEKKLVLAAATRVLAEESLALARAAAGDPAIAAEAALAAQTLERALSYRRK